MQETELLFLFLSGLCLVVTCVGFAGIMVTRGQSLDATHLRLVTAVLLVEATVMYGVYQIALPSFDQMM